MGNSNLTQAGKCQAVVQNMKKSHPFLLVRTLATQDADGRKLVKKAGQSPANSTPTRPRSTGEQFLNRALSTEALFKEQSQLERNFSATLRSTLSKSRKSFLAHSPGTSATNLNKDLTTVVNDLQAAQSVVRVGVLDLGAWLGGLPALIEKLNKAQPLYSLFELLTPIPGGLIKTQKGFGAWAQKHLGAGADAAQFQDLAPQMIEEDFFEAAESIRVAMGVDCLIGITPALIAGQNHTEIFWNHFASAQHKLILLSTADLRDFSVKAGRPFEAAVGMLLVAALLVSRNERVCYHKVDTGCIFDYNSSRVSLVDSLRAMMIDNKCQEKMPIEQRAAALAMVSALKGMKSKRAEPKGKQ